MMLMRLLRFLPFVAALMSAGSAFALELVFFSRPGCVYCLRFEKDVAPGYQKSEEGRRAPLRRWDLGTGTPPYTLSEPVRYTPTFVLVNQGREIGRITGFINDDMFWGLLGKMLRDAPPGNSGTPATSGVTP